MTALPEVLEKLEPKDLQISAYPEPIPGGMHVGLPKGVKVTHVPTGITVTCDHERSQHKNRDACLIAIAAALHAPALLRDAGDAARYRWLREQNTITENPGAWTITRCDFTDQEGPARYWVGTDLDAAVDAAMHAPGGATETPR